MAATQWVDLAAGRLGGLALEANDEFFAPKERLLRPEPPVFDPHAYGDRGKVMDGWETRRRRDDGHDWCIVRLGVPGVIREAVVDTSHFVGNHPEACSIDGCVASGDDTSDAEWVELLPKTPLAGDTANRFPIEAPWRVTHVRLNIHPDGGVARLRLLGEPVVDLRHASGPLDLASVLLGGRAVATSDAFFSSAQNLVAPGDPINMGDGWETRRRRGPGEDWAVVALAAPGRVESIEIDTTHFKGNYPDRCAVEACASDEAEPPEGAAWRELVGSTPMRPHARHRFAATDEEPATHVRLRMIPDGGVARLRVRGTIDPDARPAVGLRWLNTLLPDEATDELRACCDSDQWARQVADRRPFDDAEQLGEAADEVWRALPRDEWLRAFEAHPRIGERSGGAWSRQEQSGTSSAADETLRALEEGNREYEERFGHVFLICATGKSADEMLAALRERLGNDPDTELEVAAEEHRKITRLRLGKLLCP